MPNEEIKIPPIKELKKENYHKLNDAFALMTLIPFLVFFYLLLTKFFSFNIVIGDTGLVMAIALIIAFLGYLSGFSIVRQLLNSVITYTDKAKTAYDKLNQTQQYLIQTEKFRAIGTLASGIAHEVKNPLSIIMQGVDYLEKDGPLKDEDTLETMRMIKDSVRRADKIISGLLDFSKTAALNLADENINAILETALVLVKNQLKFEHIEIIKELKSDLSKARVDKNKMEQVFVNILLNAAQAMPEGGRITIRTYARRLIHAADGIGERKDDYFRVGETAVIVEIEDNGIGIPAESITKIFDPFFTTKGPRGGSGLGLSVSRSILDMHRGLIYAESRPGKGSKFTIILKRS